jgi:protein-ribulosamine 3-kinase
VLLRVLCLSGSKQLKFGLQLKMNEPFLKETIGSITGQTPSRINLHPVGGGSINNTYRILDNHSHTFFLKLNKADRYPGLFEKEKQGLEFLASKDCVRTPHVLFCGTHGTDQFLILEWIASGSRTDTFWKNFGEQLARLHWCTRTRFGFSDDNYMGALTQKNVETDTWTDFFIYHRIMPQVELALSNNFLDGHHVALFQQLCKKLDSFFEPELPSLLHGDLWSGNFMCDSQSAPVLIDPAVYYGHRSIDLGMTTLFGGFDRSFYDAYHYHFPLPVNHDDQWDICNLYPLLIHLNLFGQSYLGGVLDTLRKFA